MTDSRLPAHIEIGAIRRLVEGQGGFASVLFKGERDAGTILLLTMQNGSSAQLWERMPQMDGTRSWTPIVPKTVENEGDFTDYCRKRHGSDPDLWVLEADVADPAQFVETLNALS
ncbi:DUF1491 family protein [Altererythrobacter sp. MTPC7]|uniref:DUF1491 family protein n=1 Tax=Altererythrobacter sp. MTPC7 TaxID=3056567 RepID=UPI0036F309C3